MMRPFMLGALAWLMAWALVGIPWRSFAARPSLERVRLVPFADGGPVSQAMNLLAFVPCGMLGTGAGFRPPIAFAGCALVSATTEAAQVFSTRRYPSVTDFLLNAAGGAIGATLARRAPGQRRRPPR